MRFSCRSSLTPTHSGGGMALLLKTFRSNRVLLENKEEPSQAKKCLQHDLELLHSEVKKILSSESSFLRTRDSRLQRSMNLRFDCGTTDFAQFNTRLQTVTFSKPESVRDRTETSVKYRCFYQRFTCEEAKIRRDQLSLPPLRKKI
jgi:hypothetical protein